MGCALLRAGRFDRQVLVDRPDKKGRVQILGVHMKKVKLAPDVDAEKVAALTPGFSGADLANLVNEAALLATRRKADAVTMDDFNNAVERIIAGLEKKNRDLNPREREIVQLIAEGKINKQIAHLLDISVKTVETHRAAAMHKLKLGTTAELVRYAVRNNIVEP